MADAVETAIHAFMNDTHKEPEHVPKKWHNRSTQIINRKNIKTKGEAVFEKSGRGILRELTIIADREINLSVKLDGEQPFGIRSEWSDLSDITLYSDTIVARQVNSNYILNIKNLYFNSNLSVQIWFGQEAVASSIFGVYDLCEVI